MHAAALTPYSIPSFPIKVTGQIWLCAYRRGAGRTSRCSSTQPMHHMEHAIAGESGSFPDTCTQILLSIPVEQVQLYASRTLRIYFRPRAKTGNLLQPVTSRVSLWNNRSSSPVNQDRVMTTPTPSSTRERLTWCSASKRLN